MPALVPATPTASADVDAAASMLATFAAWSAPKLVASVRYANCATAPAVAGADAIDQSEWARPSETCKQTHSSNASDEAHSQSTAVTGLRAAAARTLDAPPRCRRRRCWCRRGYTAQPLQPSPVRTPRRRQQRRGRAESARPPPPGPSQGRPLVSSAAGLSPAGATTSSSNSGTRTAHPVTQVLPRAGLSVHHDRHSLHGQHV